MNTQKNLPAQIDRIVNGMEDRTPLKPLNFNLESKKPSSKNYAIKNEKVLSKCGNGFQVEKQNIHIVIPRRFKSVIKKLGLWGHSCIVFG